MDANIHEPDVFELSQPSINTRQGSAWTTLDTNKVTRDMFRAFSYHSFEISILKGLKSFEDISDYWARVEKGTSFSAPPSSMANFVQSTYSYPDKGTIVRVLPISQMTLIASNSLIKSTYDLKEANEGDYVWLSFMSRYSGEITLKELSLHWENSEKTGLELRQCNLVYKGGLRVIGEGFEEITWNFACELWSASDKNAIPDVVAKNRERDNMNSQN